MIIVYIVLNISWKVTFEQTLTKELELVMQKSPYVLETC